MVETDTTEPTREELLELLASLEAKTGVRIGPPQVARRYNQLTAQVVESFVDLGDGDSQTGVAAIMDSTPYASAFGIEGPPLRERVVSVDWATGFGFRSTTTAITIPSLMRYDVLSDDLRRHVDDWLRTRITPGADPRAEWDDEVQIEAARELMDGGTRVVEFSYVDEHGDRINCVSNESLSLQPLFDDAHRDVPCDVVRWRDPKHRAAMTERAREYASHLPGMRA